MVHLALKYGGAAESKGHGQTQPEKGFLGLSLCGGMGSLRSRTCQCGTVTTQGHCSSQLFAFTNATKTLAGLPEADSPGLKCLQMVPKGMCFLSGKTKTADCPGMGRTCYRGCPWKPTDGV